MSKTESMLVTSEMMQKGKEPLIFTGGACNIQGLDGPMRNPGRDPLEIWLDEQQFSYFEAQIHATTHGRDYIWGIDGPQEKKAREIAKIRVYEVTSTTIGAVTMMEIMDDARVGRTSVVWFNEGQIFSPLGLGTRDEVRNNNALRADIGDTAYFHLVAYINAGTQLRNEILLMLSDCPHIIFVNSFEELKNAITYLLAQQDEV